MALPLPARRPAGVSAARTVLLVATLVSGLGAGPAARADDSLFLGSKTPYAPRQDPATYEAPPPGFSVVYTELVARHGSRGLSSASSDLALADMWSKAQASGGLTKLGQRLGADLQRITRANALLGYGVAGISTPGYGNLTQVGIDEHARLAERLAARVAPLFASPAMPAAPAAAGAPATSAASVARQVLVATSGVNRAVDSSNVFSQSLVRAVPGLAASIVKTPALTAYPANAPVVQAAGVNRFQLYFHKLTPGTDLPAASDPLQSVYQASRGYQSYLASNPTMLAKVAAIGYGDEARAAARAALSTVFTPSFLDPLDRGLASYANTQSLGFTSDDGRFTTTIVGDGQTRLANLVDAANALYAVYTITPGMVAEVPVNLGKYLPGAALQTLAYLSDAQDFYQKGPGIAEAGSINSAMGQALLDDFFAEADAIAAGRLEHAAKLRFTHAEIVIPFMTLLGLPAASTAVPAAQTYTYATHPWRGENIAPLAANVQWDLVRNSAGTVLVKMLVNEQESDFKPACEPARYYAGSTTSHFYDYTRLKACYGRAAG